MKPKYCITFAGAVGSSKTPIAYYLSQRLGIPVMSNDSIRSEVSEDLLGFSQEEYERRRDERGKWIVENGMSFIYDASIDREWARLHEWLIKDGFSWFIISLDLSREFLAHLYRAKGYNESLDRIDALFAEHENFKKNYHQNISFTITDETFSQRLELSLEQVQEWIENLSPS